MSGRVSTEVGDHSGTFGVVLFFSASLFCSYTTTTNKHSRCELEEVSSWISTTAQGFHSKFSHNGCNVSPLTFYVPCEIKFNNLHCPSSRTLCDARWWWVVRVLCGARCGRVQCAVCAFSAWDACISAIFAPISRLQQTSAQTEVTLKSYDHFTFLPKCWKSNFVSK